MADEWDAFPAVQQEAPAATAPAPAQKQNDEWSAFPVVGQAGASASGSIPTMTVRPNAADDIARGAGRGLMEGAGSILGLPSDVWHMLDRGYQHALTYGAEKMGMLTPEQGAALREPIGDAESPTMNSEAINRHLLNTAKSLGANTDAPKTSAGQFAETVGSFLPSAATMGESSLPAVAKSVAKYGALPGALSETAGQATQGTDAEPYARIAGAVAPALLGASVHAASRLANPTARALEGVTPQQMTEAQRILDESRAAGAPVTTAEAIQQATGSATRASDIQRVVEQSPEGAAVMRPFFAQRPAQTQAAGRSMLNEVAPAPTDPHGVAPRVQTAAQGAVAATPQGRALADSVGRLGPQTTAEEAGNVIRPELQNIYDRREGMRAALAGQDYGAARDADYGANGAAANPVTVQPVIAHIDDQLVSAKGGVAASLRRARNTLLAAGQPDMSVTGLSNARNAITDQIAVASRAGSRSTVRALQDVLGQLDSALEDVPLYGQARRNFAAASEPLTPFAPETAPGRIIDQDQFGNNYTMPTERIAPSIQSGGATAADQFLAAAENSPASRQAFGRYFSQKLLDGARNPAGQIDAAALTNTLRQNHDILQRFPEVGQQLTQVAGARAALAEVERTPTGQLALAPGFEKQAQILFNPNPLPGSEGAVAAAVRQVAARDPEAAQQLVRMHIEKVFNEATQNNLPGANQWGGPKFAAVLAGNPQQARNLQAAITALPNGATRWAAFQKSQDIFEAMGRRQPVGSQTEFNRQIAKALEGTGAIGDIAATAASPGKWLHVASDIYRKFAFGQNTKALAQAMVSGNVRDLSRVVGSGSGSMQSQAALIALLARQGALATPDRTQP